MGVKDVENYYLPPQKTPQPPPDPHLVIAQREVAVKEASQKLAEQKFQAEAGRKQNETGLKAQREAANVQLEANKQAITHAKEAVKGNIDQQKIDLERARFEHDMVIDSAEIALQRQAQTIQATPRPVG